MTRACSWLLVLVWTVCPEPLRSAEGESLPTWQGKEIEQSAFFLGGGLWPSSALPDRGPDAVKQGGVGLHQATRNRTGDVSLIPTEDLGLAEIRPEMSDRLPAIEGELKDQFFKEVPSGFVVDPQYLLTEQKANDIHRFLEFHAEESETPIYAIILGKDQGLPGDIDLVERHGKWFGSQPAVLMSYHLEKPDSIRLVFPREFQNKLPGAIFTRIRESCLREGSAADNASDQVEKIVVELSIQLYWMQSLLERHRNFSRVEIPVPGERDALPLAAVPAAAPDPARPVLESGASEEARLAGAKDARPPEELPAQETVAVAAHLEEVKEVLPPAEAVPPAGEFVGEQNRLAPSSQAIRFFILVSGLLLTGFLLFIPVAMIQRFRRQVEKPVLFPSCHYAPRLGGEFGGGAFVGVSFEMGNFDGAL